MTGAGGWHQVGPMGWLGARIIEEQLIIQPALPPQIPHVSIRTLIFGGAGIKATMNYTHTTITRVDVRQHLPTNSSQPYANSSMPFTVGFSLVSGQNMSIVMGQTLVIENRRYFDNVTTPGNVVQCLPVDSEGAYQPGQFPLAAIDGASSTRWQPTIREPSSLTIDMSSIPYQPLTGASLDWGSRPAQNARILVWNGTSATNASNASDSGVENVHMVTFSNITISKPYDAATNDVVQEYVGNVSTFAFASPIWSGQFALLEISGCITTGDELGATVAEFSLFGANGVGLLGSSGTSNTTATSVSTVTPISTSGVVSSMATAIITPVSPTSSSVPEATSGGSSSGSRPASGALAMLALVMVLG